MDILGPLVACAVYFAAGILGVSVGGSSLITVPVLMMLGMSPQVAIATNMFALVFLCLTGSFFFGQKISVPHRGLTLFFTLLTLAGSLAGAFFVVAIDQAILKKTIAFTILAMAVTIFLARDAGEREGHAYKMSLPRMALGSLLVLILGVYGGFFSGGYMLMLGYVLVLLFDYNFLEATFLTKIFNLFSSLIACVVFWKYGLLDYRACILLSVFMSLGAWVGARLALAKGNKWLKNLFLITTLALAAKLFLFP